MPYGILAVGISPTLVEPARVALKNKCLSQSLLHDIFLIRVNLPFHITLTVKFHYTRIITKNVSK